MDTYSWYWLLESSVVLALVALFLERWVPWPEHWHPLALFRLVADYLAGKVNRPEHSHAQQRFAGILASLTLLVLVLVPSAIVIYAADFSALLGSVALWVALRRRYYLHILTNVRRLTLKGQKRAARALLTRIDDRDTDRLSTHGLAKTTLELQALSIVHHRLVPIVGWLIGGPILALGLRLIIEMAQLWPLAQARYLRFGLAPRALYVMTVGLITYVATAIAWLIASALRRRATISPSPSLTWDRPTITWLDNLSRLHNVSLGGPILVNGRRFARQRFAGRAAEKVWQTIAAAIERWQWGLTIVLMIALFWLFIYRP